MYLSNLYSKVQEALRHNDHAKAITIIKDQILPSYPEELRARKLLRGIELERITKYGRPWWPVVLGKGLSSWLRLFGAWLLRRWDRVLLEAENLLVFAPRNREILFFLGEAALHLSYLDTAIFAFRSILAVDGGNIAALRILGRLATQKEQWEQALKYYQRAVQIAPKDRKLAQQVKKIAARQAESLEAVSRLGRSTKWGRERMREARASRPEDIRKAIVKGEVRLALIESAGWARTFEPKWLQRRVRVCYYAQMTLLRSFPLLVTLAEKQGHLLPKEQGQLLPKEEISEHDENAVIEITPYLPGCQVTPISMSCNISPGFVSGRFVVTPVSREAPLGARLIIRHKGKVVEEIPTPFQIATTAWAKRLLLLGGLLPLLGLLLSITDIQLHARVPLFVLWLQRLTYMCGGAAWCGLLVGAVVLGAAIWALRRTLPREAQPCESSFEIELTPESAQALAEDEWVLPPELQAQRQEVEEKIRKLDQVLAIINKGQEIDEAQEKEISEILAEFLYDTPRRGPEYEKAIAYIRKRLQRNPDDPRLLCRLGSLYQGRGRFEEAIDLYTKVLEIEPTNIKVNFRIGDCMIAKLAQRVNSLKIKLEIYPHDENIKAQLEESETEKLEYEIEEYENRIHLQPENPENPYRLAVALLKMNRHFEAVDYLHTASAAPRYKINAYLHMGQAYLNMNDYDLAQSYFLSALEEVPPKSEKHLKILYYLGRTHERSGETSRAIEVYRQIYEQDRGYEDVADRLQRLDMLSYESVYEEDGS